MNAPAVRLENVTKTFGPLKAVDNVSLEVPAGSCYGFIGPNGSGKSTTLRMILHIIQPDQGRIEVLGSTGVRAANDRIGYLPEERGLYKKMTVRRQLAYFAELKDLSGKAAGEAMQFWLKFFRLDDRLKDKVETLSKGNSQKLQFIGAVLTRPDLLILDEPFSGLDPVSREDVLRAIVELRRQGATILFSTHDMTTASAMCDRIFMIYKGQKVLDGTLAEIQARYGSDVVRVRYRQRPALPPTGLPGVVATRDLGEEFEFQTTGDGAALLPELQRLGAVTRFEVVHPSLHDIFLRIARPDPADTQPKT